MTVPTKAAGLETNDLTEFSGSSGTFGAGSTVAANTGVIAAYAGSYVLKCFVTDADAYARVIYNDVSVVQGDDVWWGCALFLPTGFYAAQQSQTDIIRWDNVTDKYLGLTIPNGDKLLKLVEINPSPQNELVVGSRLPENRWHFIECRTKMHGTDGSAINELWVNGMMIGISTKKNMPAGGVTWTRLRAGIVATGSLQTNDSTLYVDAIYANAAKQGPAAVAASRGRGSLLRTGWMA